MGQVNCGSPTMETIFGIVKLIIDILRIAVPLILIIMGMIDLTKAVISSKEDEIKKGQKTFISRVIAAILVFFVVTIVGLLLELLPPELIGEQTKACIEKAFK